MGPHQAGAGALKQAPSPNWDARPSGTPTDTLVLHYTGMQSCAAAVERLCDPVAHVSSHYVVDEDGTVWQLVEEAHRAFHAGVSFWRGHEALNGRSIGIEIVNPGHEWGYRAFPAVQMDAVAALCTEILGRHPIPARNVVGHSDVAPDRKQDPGELFDWAGLAAKGIGLWPVSGDVPVADAEAAMRDIGYPVPDLATSLTAFQRHWRPGRVDGVVDRGTRCRLADVLAAFGAEARVGSTRLRALTGGGKAVTPQGPDGWAAAALKNEGGGKSGLHGNTVPANGRRGRP